MSRWKADHEKGEKYNSCSKKDRTFAMKTLLLILQHSKHCPHQSSLNRAQWYITYVSLDGAMHPRVCKACSKKRLNLCYYCSFYSILSTAPFKLVPSTGDTLFPFLPLLECFLEPTFCDRAQFSYCIFLISLLFVTNPTNSLCTCSVQRI
jgi:hypothetical protein